MIVSRLDKAAFIEDRTGFRCRVVEDRYKKDYLVFQFSNEDVCFNAREEVEALIREDRDKFMEIIKYIDPNVISRLRRELKEAKGNERIK